MKFPKVLNKYLGELNNLFLPAANVGGLQVTNSSIRYMQLKNGKNGPETLKDISLRLPPGIVEEGKIKDRPNFIAALKNVRSQININKKNANVVITIPTGDVYAESFGIPVVGGASLNEAVDLNMRVISPNPIEKSYYSWQVVGEEEKNSGQAEILGVFVPREVIDDLSSALEETGFGVAAIEFSSLSMARLLSFYKIIRKDLPYLLIKLTQEGLIFMILRNGHLYFDYFHSWGKFGQNGKEISLDAVNDIIRLESARVLSFYSSRWGGQIKNIILISPALIEQISSFLRNLFPGFEIAVLPSDKENLHGVRGAALRGLVPRSADKDINLMDPNQINAFWRDEIVNFIGLWRNVVLTVLVFMLAIFGGASWFLDNRLASLPIPAPRITAEETAELEQLKRSANDFNATVAMLSSFYGAKNSAYQLINQINVSAGTGVVLNRLTLNAINSGSGSGSISGIAANEAAVTSFKNSLASIPGITSVNLPLSGIITEVSGRVSFALSFNLVRP